MVDLTQIKPHMKVIGADGVPLARSITLKAIASN